MAPNTVVFTSLSIDELKSLFIDTIDTYLKYHSLPLTSASSTPSKKYVYGIDGLAKLLNCSKPTAQRHKDSGKIPFSQVGRKLVFEADAVLAAIGKGGRK